MNVRGAAAALLAAALLAAGCAGSDRGPRAVGPAASPAVIRAWHGATPALRARLALRLAEPGREPRNVDLHLWQVADGRLRAKVARLDVDVLDLRIEADGAVLAWAPRSGLVARGHLGRDGAPPLLARLRLLAGELAEGPLPAGVVPAIDADGWWRWRQGELAVRLRVDTEGRASAKTLAADDEAAVEVAYDRYRAFDGLQRAGRVRITAADLELTAVLREFNPVAAISADGLRLVPDPGARAVPISDLLEHLE